VSNEIVYFLFIYIYYIIIKYYIINKNNVLAWSDIVVVSAIDCADDDNNPICREYEIMHYPMLKYFSINAHSPSLGIVIEKGDSIDSVRSNLIDRLETEQQEGRGSTWPNIAPYRYVKNFP